MRPLYFIFGAFVLALLFPYSLLYLFSYHFVFHLKFMEFIRDLRGESNLCSSTRTLSPFIHVCIKVFVCICECSKCILFAIGHRAAHKRTADKDAQKMIFFAVGKYFYLVSLTDILNTYLEWKRCRYFKRTSIEIKKETIDGSSECEMTMPYDINDAYRNV